MDPPGCATGGAILPSDARTRAVALAHSGTERRSLALGAPRPVGHERLALVEDPRRADTAALAVEPGIDRADRLVLRVEHPVAADQIQESSTSEDLANSAFQPAQVQRAAGVAREPCLVDEQLAAGDVDKVDSAADQ